MAATISNLVQEAREQLSTLTGLALGSTVSVHRDESNWRVQVEVVEKKSMPDSQDILATYDLTVDQDANILNFARIGMRKRNQTVESVNSDLEV